MREVSIPRSTIGQVYGVAQHIYAVRSLASFFEVLTNRHSRYRSIYHKLRLIEYRHDRLLDRLDRNSVISPSPHEREIVAQARAMKVDLLASFSAKPQTAIIDAFLEKAKDRCRNARKAEHIARIVWALKEAELDGWYPVFVTLTVAPEYYQEVFFRKSGTWKNYIRQVHRNVGYRLGLNRREADNAEIHKYFAVVERGGRTGRLHVHVLHLCKALPVDCVDPNSGRSVPDRRELSAWVRFWEHGFVSACPVRTCEFDVYGRSGFVWPVKREGKIFAPYRSTGIVGIANYIAKYLSKTLYDEETERMWRCRMSRNFGIRTMTTIIQSLTTRKLWMIANGVLPRIRMMERTIPQNLLRRLAIKEVIRRVPVATSLKWFGRLEAAPSLLSTLRMMTTYTSITTMRDLGDFRWLQEQFDPSVPRWHTSGVV